MADLKDLSDAIGDIQRFTRNRQFLRNIGKILIKRIRTRTRLGKGAKEPQGNNFPSAHKLPGLKDQTKKRRRRLKRAGGLTGPGATPAKSGVNRSGKTLNEMHLKIEGSTLVLKLSPRGKVIAEDLIDLNPDWEFFNLSKAEFNFLRDEIEKEVNKLLRRRLG